MGKLRVCIQASRGNGNLGASEHQWAARIFVIGYSVSRRHPTGQAGDRS